MSDAHRHDPALAQMADEAAAWVLRCDRGLSAAEQDEFSVWLAADPRHGAQLARHRRHWQRLDGLARWRPEHGERPNPDLLAPPRAIRFPIWARWAMPLAAAAALALAYISGTADRPQPAAVRGRGSITVHTDPNRSRVLPDGTAVELNRDAVIAERFTTTERRVMLERGEAHFVVTKNPARPFIVHAGGIDVRAVGTAFNVRVEAAAVEVLVTEGRVGVERAPAGALPPGGEKPLELAARQRAVVSRGAPVEPPQVATLTPGEIERVLAWQYRLLDFNAAPLSAIAAEFNHRNAVQLVVTDPELAALRISAAFRSDNVDGFVRLLEAGFGVRAERRSEIEIVLVRDQR